MSKFSKDKRIHKAFAQIVKKPNWDYERQKNHWVLIAPSGVKFSVAGTPSDQNAFHQFRREVNRVAGEKVIDHQGRVL